MSLQKEIDDKSKEIHTDGYPVSLGELITMYKDGELDIHPEFQRFFRWNIEQKSRLIESILLGIPVPSIFVSQREDGVWDVIDGLQRLSTILEFVGELKDDTNKKIPPSVLVSTYYLPALSNKKWEDETDTVNSFTQTQRLTLKRAKLDVKIVKKQSDKDAKYELFQRLNTGGSSLSLQEIRNCLLVMLNRTFFRWLKDLTSFPAFQNCIALSERLKDEQYDMELVLRFFIYKSLEGNELEGVRDIGEFVTSRMLEFAKNKKFPFKLEEANFKKTFTLLNECLPEEVFTKYDLAKERFLGSFSISAFEVIAIGLGKNVSSYPSKTDPELLQLMTEKIKNIWKDEIYKAHSGTGLRAGNRIPHLIPLGENLFKYENQNS